MYLQRRGAHLEHNFERQWNKEFLLYRLEILEMSATQAWPNVADVLCQSKYNFRSYSIFDDDRFVCVTLYYVTLLEHAPSPQRHVSLFFSLLSMTCCQSAEDLSLDATLVRV